MKLFGESTSYTSNNPIINRGVHGVNVIRSWCQRHQDILFHCAAAALLIVAMAAYVYRLDSPKNLEVYRDYLISSHIAAHGERPLTGPSNQIFPLLRNSFDYPYFLALFLAIKDDVLFLSIINIVLQILTLFFFYVLGKRLFGGGTALIALVLYAFSYQGLMHASEIWAPYLVPLFLNVSFLLLLAGFKRNNLLLLIGSIFFFVVALTFHYSVVSLVFLFLITVWLIVRSQGRPLGNYVLALGSFFFFILVLYVPTLIYLSTISFRSGRLQVDRMMVGSLHAYVQAFALNMQTFLHAFFLDSMWPLRDVLLVVIGVAALGYGMFISRAEKVKRIIVLLMCIAILQPLLFSALFQTTRWAYYFISIFGLFLLLVADIINTVLAKKAVLIAAKIVLVVLLIKVFSSDFYVMRTTSRLHLSLQAHHGAITAIRDKILSLQRSEQYEAPNFFQFLVVKGKSSFNDHDAHFWAGLEKKFNRQFIELVDSASGYAVLNTSDYIFVSCQEFANQQDEKTGCLDLFFRQHNNYAFIGHIFQQYPYSIYVTKRVDAK